ncbi:MAG: site-2 protease family protein [Gammaproteobacteria bacterium]
MTIVQKIAIWALPLIFAITLHEVAHGYVASWFGDQTARLSGRLTLNPIKHIDVVGTLIIPGLMLMVSNFVFGWAKPVPVDARNLRNPRRDMALVALAGPISNLIMAFFWGLVAKLGLLAEIYGNGWFGIPLTYMGGAGIMINVVLGVLNLIPLPPLDGGKVLSSILPPRAAYQYDKIEPYGFLILLVLMFIGALSKVMAPFVFFIVNLIGSLFGLT